MFDNNNFDLTNKAILDQFLGRINNLHPSSPAQWGKMNVSQMMSHCSESLKLAKGETKLERVFVGYLFGKLGKKTIHNDKPFGKNLPTDKSFKMTEAKEFDKEKQILISQLTGFSEGGLSKTTKEAHPFFGKLLPEEWNRLQGKHLDHHLRQFGV